MKITAFIMTAGLLLAACTPAAEMAAGDSGVTSAATCAERGGEMKRVGRAQTLQCVLNYSDAGKVCTTGSQCQGDCLTDREETQSTPVQGRCAPTSERFGCRTKVENGVAQPTLCID